MKICFVFFFFLIPFQPAAAQDDSLFTTWAEMSDENTAILENIQRLAENPLSLNEASRAELSQIPFLTSVHMDSILSYRRRKGRFKSRRPLRKILGAELYNILKPFFTIQSKKPKRAYLIQKNYFPIDPSDAARRYPGGLWYNKSKMYYSVNKNISAGFITQKDVGEENIMDFYSAYFSRNTRRWQFILGQFHFQFAHGLTLGNPFSTQKSAMVLNPLRPLKTVASPSLSSAENSGLFGIYLRFLSGRAWAFHLFASGNHLDARLDKNGNTVTGIRYSGYHRSPLETASKDRLYEQLSAAAGSFSSGKHFKAALLLCRYRYTPAIRFTAPYVSPSDLRRQYFHFSGNRLTQFSLSYSAGGKTVDLSGELSDSDKGSPGFSQKLFFRFQRLQFGISYWRLSKNFQSPRGAVFADGNAFPSAQQGLYLAIQTKVNDILTIKAYRFFVKDLWRSWFNSLPGLKDEWLLEGLFSLPKKQVTLRIRQKSSAVSTAGEDDFLYEEIQTLYRLHYKWTPNKNFRLQSRIAGTVLNPGKEHGLYFFQDFRMSFLRKLALYFRITFFQTRSFRSALYEYESDLPGSFANYALYGQGHKWYLMLRVRAAAGIRFWLKRRYLQRYPKFGYRALRQRELRFQADMRL